MAAEKMQGVHVVAGALDASMWRARGQMYSFLGNELLVPMNRSGNLQGIDPAFWGQVPVPDNDAGRHGLSRLRWYAQRSVAGGEESDAVSAGAGGGVSGDGASNAGGFTSTPGLLASSVEFAHLFIGPPSPAACPWETVNDPQNEGKIGYGRSTVVMQQLLLEEGFELSNENHQYEDHIGIELLYLAVLCDKAVAALGAATTDEAVAAAVGPFAAKVAWFAQEHPLAWIGRLRENVDAACPNGYYSALLEYTQGLLESHVAAVATR